jgi:SAM-dependent methyltransferase
MRFRFMQPKSKIPLMKNDFGGWAQHYASIPYDHYRQEAYQLFIEILVHLKSHSRVLDVGAGTGNLSYEYFKRYPKSACRFVLMDASRELLKVAENRFASRSGQVSTVLRSYNLEDWHEGLGKFDAIVSNNSLFHLRPQSLAGFFEACYYRLRKNGVLLNQQAFGYESRNRPAVADSFSRFVQTLPQCILPQYAVSGTKVDLRRLQIERKAAGKRRVREIKQARAAGIEIAEADEYQYLTAEKHLDCMRSVGFTAGSIWQKRDFAVLMGVKGKPLGSDSLCR